MKIKGKQKFLKVLACNLAYLRESKGISMQALADDLDLEKSRYAKWEEGVCAPRYDAIITVSRYFGVTIDDLLTTYLSYGTGTKAA